MQNDEQSHEMADENEGMHPEGAVNPNTELRKRRSTRIVQAVPLVVTGVDALGRPFAERTSSLIINCHGCRYQSKHYVLKNMWVNLEVPHPEPGHVPRKVRGKVAWIQRPRTVRQLFQVALELELPGNVWGIAFPPEDWFVFPEGEAFPHQAAAAELSATAASTGPGQSLLGDQPPEGAGVPPDNLRIFPAPGSATDASMQLARQMARLLSEAKQQLSAAVQEAATQAVSSERRQAGEQWEQKYAAFREEVARVAANTIASIREESESQARGAHAATAEDLKNQLPQMLAPHLEKLAHEFTTQMAKEGAAQRQQHETQLAAAQEALASICAQADQAIEKLKSHAAKVEAQVSARLEDTAKRVEEESQKRSEWAVNSRDQLNAAVKEIQERVAATQTEAQSTLRGQLAKEVEDALGRWQNSLADVMRSAREQTADDLRSYGAQLRAELEGEGKKQGEALQNTLHTHTQQLTETLAGAKTAAEQFEQYPAKMDAARQQALAGFQAQVEDVSNKHRDGLHKRSETVLEDVHARIRSSFDEANSAALEKFDAQIQALVAPRLKETEEAIHRLAGGRSLLDAALTMQQERIRTVADEAFADSLARFRENLGTVEMVLNESAQTITSRHLEETESKSADLKHRTVEEMFKSAEWYEKKAQSQLQNLTEKLVEHAGAQLREKAGELSGLFTSELSHASQNYVEQSQLRMEDTVKDAFDRVRMLFAEAADTTSAAFTDEIQRNARQELEGFNELTKKSVEESREKVDAVRAGIHQQLTLEQEGFLQRFQAMMNEAAEKELRGAQERAREHFSAIAGSWNDLGRQAQAEARGGMARTNDELAEQYRGRLENISNAWMVATVTTLDHQSRDVIAKIAATAEERLREASSEVFTRFGETLRDRLQQIASGFEKPKE
ncbi:MAG TPA: hypothetical protein VF758_05480 [Candidatus Acidoferrum sp.]